MVLRNCENEKYRRKTGRKTHKIKGKRLVLAEKRYIDLSLNSKQGAGSRLDSGLSGSLCVA